MAATRTFEIERESSPAPVPDAVSTPGRGRRYAMVALLLVPAAVILWCGWRHRWTADDGFINLRVVRQVVDGNGPVFNAGRRVETGTSPAWIAELSFLDVVTPLRLEWIAAITALLSTAGALVLAVFGTRRALAAIGLRGTFLPLGALVYACLPPAWDYATSGLETGMSLLWLAGSWWFLCGRIGDRGRSGKVPWYVAVVLGLGALVRPDFLVFSVFFVVAMLFLSGRRGWLRIVAWAAALPIITELARMTYFGSLVPNTAIAKEASLSYWSQGWSYFIDFVGNYALVIPIVALGVIAWAQLRAIAWPAKRDFVLLAALTASAGLVHSIYVVKVGGDFMHARLLLPACFVVLLPVSVVVARAAVWVGVGLVAVWSLLAMFVLRPPYSGAASRAGVEGAFDAINARTGIGDERLFYVRKSGAEHPVTLDDYLRHDRWANAGVATRRLASRERAPVLVIRALSDQPVVVPLRPGTSSRSVVSAEALGLFSYAAGTGIDVIDDHGLAETVASHQRLRGRGRPGHEKVLPDVWVFARFAADDAPRPKGMTLEQVTDARRALSCGGLHDLITSTTGSWQPSDAGSNLIEAVRSFGFRFPSDPKAAVRELC